MIDQKVVEYIAKLAKVEINEQEKDFLSSQLSKIISYIDKLKEVDTKKVKPMRGLYTGKELMRKDQVKISSAREDILKNAPDFLDDYFKIPKVIK
ncbi:MAG: Asp-tRNA(Asn)/Glu-tRNA(Gln) amidotransferase subunit GatC [Candidatus Omnitrophica bacterium]|nr:Asp-tRNA(Asn)/Glu-tRNA(Gln) amidotransferase subunit GatC [Candidatus Omnitrophota bacterium]MCF7893998.1 Asp-tRNA(Asn)/Glu-tRNA(Gln) amidotransferase subunit GatC [Candidatus Omnitrophota bacterium]